VEIILALAGGQRDGLRARRVGARARRVGMRTVVKFLAA